MKYIAVNVTLLVKEEDRDGIHDVLSDLRDDGGYSIVEWKKTDIKDREMTAEQAREEFETDCV